MSAALAGIRLLVSAGPTFEDIDPVRFIGNRSSGKMGFAIAAVAAERGAAVVLVAGPVHMSTPAGVHRIDVRSAAQMHAAVMAWLETGQTPCDAYIGAAAVADFTPLAIAPAMNHRMWRHPATQANIATLRARGVQVVGPDDGPLAEGESGPGRMAEPAAIVAALDRWKRAHGEYPERLEDLVPSELPALDMPQVGEGLWHYQRIAPTRFKLKFFVGALYEGDSYDSDEGTWYVDR